MTGGSEAVRVVDPEAIEEGTDALGIGDGTAPPGTYVLLFTLDSAATITVGALGTATFPAGAYAYVGSAFGSNGLGRVDRHRRVAAGAHDVQHWHVDYLGSHPDVALDAVVVVPRADVECRLSIEIADAVDRLPAVVPTPLEGFGASDCTCGTHLLGGGDTDTLGDAVVALAETVTRS
mgnify:CR=1 FL=1